MTPTSDADAYLAGVRAIFDRAAAAAAAAADAESAATPGTVEYRIALVESRLAHHTLDAAAGILNATYDARALARQERPQ